MINVVLQVSESNGEFFLKSSELFESPVYLEEAADVLCILQAGVFLYLWWCFLTSHKCNKAIWELLLETGFLFPSETL